MLVHGGGQAVRSGELPRRPHDAGLLRLGAAPFRRRRAAGGPGRLRPAAEAGGGAPGRRGDPRGAGRRGGVAASCSRSRPTWTPTTATASPSCASPRAAFTRGMKLKVQNTGRQLSVNSPMHVLRLRARAGRGGLRRRRDRHPQPRGAAGRRQPVGERARCASPACPTSPRRSCSRVRVKDPLKAKHLKKALEGLAEEGVTQLFRPTFGADFIVGAVGQLQFEVMADRLAGEYGLDVVFEAAPYAEARWLAGDAGRHRGLRRQAPHRDGRGHRRGPGVPRQVAPGRSATSPSGSRRWSSSGRRSGRDRRARRTRSLTISPH